MFDKLDRSDYVLIRPMTRQMPMACAVDATLDGICPGSVWVDDLNHPRTALVDTPEGYYLVGAPPLRSVQEAIGDFVRATLDPGGRGGNWWWFYVRCPTTEWAAAMRNTLPTAHTVETPRSFYLGEEVNYDWRSHLKPDFDLVMVDETILGQEDLGIERLRRQASSNFGSIAGFLERGFASCIIHAGRIVCTCVADNASGTRCEVGVHTDPQYRRQGLGTLAVARAVEWALEHGFTQIGWHCLRFNDASAATARKVGFRWHSDYAAFHICRYPADAAIIEGNLLLLEGSYAQAARSYERALKMGSGANASSYLLRSDQALVHYHLQTATAQALAGDRDLAVKALEKSHEVTGIRQGGF